ncbi:MAG: T9SS type A sorting domain-containing protein [Chitinophagaceae bacterium]|nr:MAG: T9SS type A sorting domain-containing protein [Chitinophagaceae bacterium]
MRKIYLTLLSGFVFLLLCLQSSAQVSLYGFTASSGLYAPLIGGVATNITSDDGVQEVPIGFSFNFGGVAYSYAVISANGAFKLGQSPGTAFASGWTNLLSNTSLNPVVAPLWDDNNATGATISYLTEGASPSRTFTVEWKNLHLGGGGSATSPTGTFKATITEGTNTIVFSYGTIAALTASTYSIGAVDLSSFISITPGAPATSSTNTAANGLNSATNLPSGTVFTLALPACDAGSLVGGTTVSSLATACAGANMTLSVNGGTGVSTGLTYEWQTSPDGTTWTAVGTDPTFNTVQTVATYYRRKLTCGATTVYSTSLLVGQNPAIDCYCDLNLTDTPSDEDIITNFKITNAAGATFSQASTNDASNYTRYNNTPFDIARQTTVTIDITTGPDFVYGQHTAAWVDFNRNNIFEASENVALSADPADGETVVTYTFNVPASAVLGNTRIRIRGGSDDGFEYTADAACDTYDYGETEDYILNIIAAPACITPVGAVFSAVEQTTATLSWSATTPTPGVGYEYEIRTTGAAGSGATGLTVAGASATPTANVTGLLPGTLYSVYLRSVCVTGSLYSNWSPAFTFKTPCNAITAFPFNETFENNSPTRICWNLDDYTFGTTNWTFASGSHPLFGNSAHSGALNAQFFKNSYDGFSTRMVSPAMDLTSLTNGARLTFWYTLPEWLFFFADQDELRVYYKTSKTGNWTIIPGATFVTNQPEWVKVELELPDPSAEYYIAFEGTALYGYGVGVDDVKVDELPLIDVGVSGLTRPLPVCPVGPQTFGVNVTNYNIIPVDFSQQPITVTAIITGTGNGTLTRTINTGTLGAGEVLAVTMPPFPFVAGSYSLQVSTASANDLNTSNNTFSTSFIVNPTPASPTITQSAPVICAGASQQLTANGAGNAITWTPVTGLYTDAATVYPYYASVVSSTVYAKPAGTTTYSAIATSSFGCPSAATPVVVTVNALPAVTAGALPATVCISDESIALTGSPAGGFWSGVGVSGNNFIPANTGIGSYALTYTYTSPLGCVNRATTTAVVVDCPERRVLLRDNAIVLYPNPNNGQFSVKMNSTLYNKLGMKVYTASGLVARTQEFSGLAYGRVIPVDLTSLPAGTYLVHFYYDGGTNYSDKTVTVVIGR